MNTKITKSFALTKELQLALFLVVSFGLFGFANAKYADRICKKVVVTITNDSLYQFVSTEDIRELLAEGNHAAYAGIQINKINLHAIESKLEENAYTANAEVSLDATGNLIVSATQKKPLARLYNDDGTDFFVDAEGRLFPENKEYSPRVLLIFGMPWAWQVNKDMNEMPEGKAFTELLSLIEKDAFWRAQIAEIWINYKGELTLMPQVGNQIIEFGTTANSSNKLKKLSAFYKQIVDKAGWNKYRKVSVKFKNQIVCEKINS